MSEDDGSSSVSGNGKSLFDSLIGSAAAGITLAGAFIYGAGALTVALQLAFTHLPWESVVGQLPNTLLITDGFGQVVLPAVIVGLLGSVLLNYLLHGDGREDPRDSGTYPVRWRLQHYLRSGPSTKHFVAWLVTAAMLGAIESAITTAFYGYHASRYYDQDILLPVWQAFLIMWALSSAAIGIALILMPAPVEKRALSRKEIGESLRNSVIFAPARTKSSHDNALDRKEATEFRGRDNWKYPGWAWRALVTILVTFAVIPGMAGISASRLFPATYVCSSDYPGGQVAGNIIAINNGWAYLVSYHMRTSSGKTYITGEFFRLIPLSSATELKIGYGNSCTR
jgi:hypothetical protein